MQRRLRRIELRPWVTELHGACNSAFTLGRKSYDMSSDLSNSSDVCPCVKALGHMCGDEVGVSPASSIFSTCNDVTLCLNVRCLSVSGSIEKHGHFLGHIAHILQCTSPDKSLHMQLKTLLATLFNGSVHTSHLWSDFSSDMHYRMCTMCQRMCSRFSREPFTLRHISTHI